MQFRIEQHFAAPRAAVERAFTDEAFLAELGKLPKLGDPKLVHKVVAGPLVHLWVHYTFTGDVSAAVKRVVDPKRLTWTEESTLDTRTHRTVWRIVPDNYGSLLKASGSYQLDDATPDGTAGPHGTSASGTVRVAEGEVRVGVPLVGSKVEAAIVSGLREHAKAEESVMDNYLA